MALQKRAEHRSPLFQEKMASAGANSTLELTLIIHIIFAMSASA